MAHRSALGLVTPWMLLTARSGEPRIVYVDQDADYRVTVLAPNFASFVRGLVDQDESAADADA